MLRRWSWGAIAAVGISAVVWLNSCSEPSGPCADCPASGSIVSNPIQTSIVATTGTLPSSSTFSAEPLVYVSLPPGTVPNGARASIQRVGDSTAFATAVVDGGFDPVPIVANAGDVISVEVKNASGVVLVQLSTTVMPTRPPVVVRAYPPPKKRDVPLNTAIVVVFSEPVEPSTLTPSSIALRRGADAVGGTVSLLEGSQTIAVFRPNDQLAPNTDYRLVVTDAVTDLDGTPLAEGVTVDFTTGQSLSGPAVSIQISPDTVYLTQSMTYQLTATVRDAAGNMLLNLPLSWATNDTAGLTASATGRVTALAPGFYLVTTSLGQLAGFARVIVRPGVPGALQITPHAAAVGASGDTILLTATVHDAFGRLLRYPDVSWSSSATGAAVVERYEPGDGRVGLGVVTGVALGTATITARSGAATDSISVTVVPPPPVASVTIGASPARLLVDLPRQLSATLRDANDRVLLGRQIAWTTDNPAIATVDATGMVRGRSEGLIHVIATSEGVSDTVRIPVIAIHLQSIIPGRYHTCAVATDGAAYCWGDNLYKQLGDSTVIPRLVPVPVVGDIVFSMVSTMAFDTCGLDLGGNAYCWGYNNAGQLGNGSRGDTTTPKPVTGGHVFTALRAGWQHTCGLTADGGVYCWGDNHYGELGDGTNNSSYVPTLVAGGVTFSSISSWGPHVCALDQQGTAYCWGDNEAGELGTGSQANSSVPVRVNSDVLLSAVSTGGLYTCAISTDDTPYCWGNNSDGELGDGTKTNRNVPGVVSGGLHFVTIATGDAHTCALTADGTAYCWGRNGDGELGNGSTTGSTTPVAVAGGHQFSAISAGGLHTCALAVDGVAYCWGYNLFAQLGDGTTTSSSVPVRVAGQP